MVSKIEAPSSIAERNLHNFAMMVKLVAFKKPPEGLRPWMVEINVEYDFILSSLAKHFQCL